MVQGSFLVFVITFWCVFLAYRALLKKKSGLKLPPSLPAIPILGSLPFMSGLDKIHVTLTELSKRYGHIYAFKAGSVYLVILNSYRAVQDALVKTSTEFAGRMDLYSEKLLLAANRGIAFRNFGEVFKRNHQISLSILKDFGYGTLTAMEDIIQTEMVELVKYVREQNGTSFMPLTIFHHSSLNVINNFMFGERYGSPGDPDAHTVLSLNSGIIESHDLLLELIPLTRYLPKYRKLQENMQKVGEKTLEFYTRKIAQSLKMTSERKNFVQQFVEKAGAAYDEKELIFVLRDLFVGGTETTASMLGWSVIVIGNDPEIQQRLHEELDAVIPKERYPTLDDRLRLPYFEATMLELLRSRAVVPLAIPHCTTKDTNVYGYHIPANTPVLMNVWGAQRDPEVWSDPDIFRPERFLNEEGQVTNRNMMITFSLGKRSCLGEQLARQEFFLFLAVLIQKFIILPPEGQSSIRDEAIVKMTTGPKPFEARLLPRY